MSIAPLTFTGVSQYSSDFQSILNRTVQIAQIPVTALQNRDSDLLQKKSQLASLNGAVASLASDLKALGTAAANKALSATSSDATVVTASNSGATTAASYTINSVTSTATTAAERSLTGYADSSATQVSSTGTVDLVVGSTHHTFTLAQNNLVSLRDQINGLGAGVTASILTTGNGNYLSLTANSPGATTLKLVDDPTGAATNLLTNTNQGTDAVFQLNGITIHQPNNSVNNVIPGLSFTLQKSSSTPVTLSLQSDPTQLSSTLQNFVADYNTLNGQLRAQTGSGAGLLVGDIAVTGLQGLLRQITSYSAGSGSVTNLSALGITFDGTGKASFDSSVFSSLSGAQINDAFNLLGSATKGLGAFSQSLSQYSDPITGLIKIEQAGIDTTDKSLQGQITTLTDRINAQQASLSKQLAAADAFEARLESQQKGVTASLQGLSLVLYGKNPTQ